MTVGDLKKALRDADDALPVYVSTTAAMYDVVKARFVPECSIAPASFDIETTNPFDW